MTDPTPGARHVSNERDPWAKVPEALLYSDLSDKAVRVYACLHRHGDDPANCYPSHARIAALIGCADRSIARPLAELEAAGWIVKKPRYQPDGRRTSDGYYVKLTSTSSAVPTRENVGGDHAEVRNAHHASERDEREQVTTKESQGSNDAGPPSSRREALALTGESPAKMDDALRESGKAAVERLRAERSKAA